MKTAQKEEKQVEFADDKRSVILVDELAEIEAEDPTFGGMREEAALEEAFEEAVTALRELYLDRFRNQPPADELALFKELVEEVNLPHEQAIHKLFRIMKQHERYMKLEEKEILDAMKDFSERIKAL